MGEQVTVACSLPNGMKLHTYDNGGQKVEVTLRGNRLPVHPKTGREIHAFEIAGASQIGQGGFGLTPGVDRDLWERIEAESRDTPPFRAGLIFALPSLDQTRDAANAMAGGVRSGLEGLDPDKSGPKLERATFDTN